MILALGRYFVRVWPVSSLGSLLAGTAETPGEHLGGN